MMCATAIYCNIYVKYTEAEKENQLGRPLQAESGVTEAQLELSQFIFPKFRYLQQYQNPNGGEMASLKSGKV